MGDSNVSLMGIPVHICDKAPREGITLLSPTLGRRCPYCGGEMDFDNPNSVQTGYAGQYAEEKMVRQPQIKDRIAMAVRHAEEKLAAVKRAKEILDKNPDLEELLDIMQKSHF